uniref:F-box domain-containing protein n=1 Tax=Caenorhabditis tropicalis TaxID=1561998 RepID=A0A1I7UDP5_9PELO
MSIITQDALKAISEQLSPTSRLNLAAIDQRFFEAAAKWHDVKTIVFDDDDVTLAGANFVHTYENAAFQKKGDKILYKTEARETALNLCPALKKLIIQARLADCDVVMLNKLNLKITKLYISIENLSLVNFPKFEKLRTLHLVYNCVKDLKVVEVVEMRVLVATFPPTLRRVCLTGIYLTETLLTVLSSLPNLVCLDLIGCLVDTRVGAKYIPLLEKFPSLDELSLPPSLFSFSTKAKTPENFSLKQLKVTKIAIFMDQFDDDLFYSQSRHFLPKNLKYLVVFGNYMPLRRWKLLSSIQNFMIIFGPNTSMASCPQANLTNVKLLSHLVRSPPYIQQEYNPNFLRNHDTNIGNLNWQFSLIEWKDNNGCRREVEALRQRMHAIGDEEIVFEGIRIPAPVISRRFGEFAENAFRRIMPGSPEQLVPQPPPLPTTTPPPTRRVSRSRRNRLNQHQPLPRRGSRRRNRSAPPLSEMPATTQSLRTNPPSPPVPTNSGAVFNATLPMISPITVATNPSVSTATTGVMNRGFLATPGTTSSMAVTTSQPTRRQSASPMNSEMTASPERPAPAQPPTGINGNPENPPGNQN